MVQTFICVRDVVPAAEADIGDLRKPILTIPYFMSERWISKNVKLSPEARNVLGAWASEIEAETGAPMTSFDWPKGPSPREFGELLRYPLFARSVAARCSMADPVSMSSIMDMFRPTVMRFREAITKHAHLAEQTLLSTLMRSVMKHGSEEEMEDTVEFAALTAFFFPYPGLVETMAEFPSRFGAVSTFIGELSSLMSSVDHLTRQVDRTPSSELFHAFFSFVPSRRVSAEFKTATDVDMSWAAALPLDRWVPQDDEVRSLVQAIRQAVAEDSGFVWSGKTDGVGWVSEYVRDGLGYPLFLPSFALRLCLLLPHRFPSWHVVFADAIRPFTKLRSEKARALIHGDHVSFAETGIAIYDGLTLDEKATVHRWMVLEGLFCPSPALVAFLSERHDPLGRFTDDAGRLAARRLESTRLPYRWPTVPRTRPDEDSETAEVVGSHRVHLN